MLPLALMALRNDRHGTTGFKPTELFFSFRVKDLSLPPISNRHVALQPHGEAARNIAGRRLKATRRFKDRHFREGSTALLRRPHRPGKLQLSGEEVRVVRQLDSHVVDVEDSAGRVQRVTTSRISPLPPTEQPTLQQPLPTTKQPGLVDLLLGSQIT